MPVEVLPREEQSVPDVDIDGWIREHVHLTGNCDPDLGGKGTKNVKRKTTKDPENGRERGVQHPFEETCTKRNA